MAFVVIDHELKPAQCYKVVATAREPEAHFATSFIDMLTYFTGVSIESLIHKEACT